MLATLFVTLSMAFAPQTFTFDTNKAQEPFEISIPVPDGNYLVTVQIGSAKRAAATFVKAESRRLCVDDLRTAKGEVKTVRFVVNKRDAVIRRDGRETGSVRLKGREYGKLNWDGDLTLEIAGESPAVKSVSIEPAPDDVTTIFLCGDSTVVDQDNEPWASWGQMFPAFWDDRVAIANYAESGERTDTFIGAGRLDKILSVMKPGDYVFVEFGHNDQKIDSRKGGGAYYFFATQLKTFIDEVRGAGGYPVLVSPTHRRNFDPAGKIIESHLDYPEAMEWVAKREGVPFIDLHSMSAKFYEALGPENSTKAFVHYPAGAFPGMDRETKDNTHFNAYGAYELAKCVLAALQASGLPVSVHIAGFSGFNPSLPDAAESFRWPLSPYRSLEAQKAEKDDEPSGAEPRR